MSEICYKKNYIKEVIARLDFLNNQSDFEKGLPIEFLEKIKSRFPIAETSSGVVNNIQVSDTEVVKSQEKYTEWIFHGINREKSIKVSPKYIVVSLNKYYNNDDFLNDFTAPINLLLKEPSIQIQRTGIRFINVFDDFINEYSDISNYFAPMISASFNSLYKSESCSRNLLITEYLLNDIKMRMQSGIFNQNYPSIVTKKDFIIDIDAFIDFPHIISDVSGFLNTIHTHIQDLFESCITDKLRSKLDE